MEMRKEAEDTRDKMPELLSEKLAANGYTDISVLAVNERKGRYCVKAEKDGRKWFIKWNDPAETEHHRAFLRERKIYAALEGSGAVPETDLSDDGLTVTAFLDDAPTLRDVLLSYRREGRAGGQLQDDAFAAFRAAVDSYVSFLGRMAEMADILKGELDTRDFGTDLLRHLRQLYMSGPAGTSSGRLRRAVNKMRYKALSGHFRRSFGDIARRPGTVPIHGDLHLNNFLMKDGAVLIDFEDVHTGSCEAEAAYFVTQAMELAPDEKTGDAMYEYAVGALRGYLDEALFAYCAGVYSLAVSSNPRFLAGSSPRGLRTRLTRLKKAIMYDKLMKSRELSK